MKLLKQILTGLAVLALAIVIVDCNKNLQQVLEEQASKLGAELAANATVGAVSTSASDEATAPSQMKTETNQSGDRISEPKMEAAGSSDAVKCVQEDSVPVERETSKSKCSQVPQSSKKFKSKKNKAVAATPDEPEAHVVASAGADESKKNDEKPKSDEESKEATHTGGDHQKEVKPAKDEDESASVDEQQQRSKTNKKEAREEKASKNRENKNKTSKKPKGDAKKRDKRETKKSGSGKNGKTKRSMEKSRKYESKKKSKK